MDEKKGLAALGREVIKKRPDPWVEETKNVALIKKELIKK
jgi:hypothetical protein